MVGSQPNSVAGLFIFEFRVLVFQILYLRRLNYDTGKIIYIVILNILTL